MCSRSQPKLQAQVDLGAMSCLLEHFQLQGVMCLGASAARYGEVGRYFKYRYEFGGRGELQLSTSVWRWLRFSQG